MTLPGSKRVGRAGDICMEEERERVCCEALLQDCQNLMKCRGWQWEEASVYRKVK